MFTYILIRDGGSDGVVHKVKCIADRDGIDLPNASMNDFACYLTDLMLKGWRVGDGSKTAIKSVIKTFADMGTDPFILRETSYGDANWEDFVLVLPGFVKYMEYTACQRYLRSIGSTSPRFSSTLVFDSDDNVPLLSVLRSLSPGRVQLTGKNGTGVTEFVGEISVKRFDTDNTWESKPLPEEISKIANVINQHVTRIDKEFAETNEKMLTSLRKAVEEARSKEMSKQFKNLQRMFSAGWELKTVPSLGNKEMYHMTKDIVVEYLEIPLKSITGRSVDSSSIVTIPLPPSYKKYMIVKNLVVQAEDKIHHAWAKGHSPHLSGGNGGDYSSVCIGDSQGKPISEISTLSESLRHVNMGSMFSNSSSNMIHAFVNKVKEGFAKTGQVDLIDPKTNENYGRLEISAGRLKGQKGTLFSTATAFTAGSGEEMAVVEEDEGMWDDE
jgi:hypothetical protein